MGGAGISGLALAFALRRAGLPVVVIESESRAGGKIETDRSGGYLCERGPASYLDRDGSIGELAHDLGIARRVTWASAAAERRLVAVGRHLHDTPRSASELARSSLLPWSAKLRAGLDLLLPRGPSARGEDESVTAFARRRLGITAGERLLEPLVSGLYAGDPDQVSLPAAFPMLAAKERDHRSFLLAMRRELAPVRNGAGPRLASFQDGLAELTSALALALGPDLHLQTRIVKVDRQPQGFRVTVEDHGMVHTLAADAVALAMPAYAAGAIVAALDAAAADALALTPYVPVALVHLGYAAAAIARPLAAYGFFVPPSEPLRVLGGIFPSQLFAGRAPPGHHLLSVRTGGARHPEALAMSDQELLELAHEELTPLLDLRSPPAFVRIVRHERALPQYTLGHTQRIATLAAAQMRHPGLFFHGNAYHNAGVPELVRRSTELAQRIARFLKPDQAQP